MLSIQILKVFISYRIPPENANTHEGGRRVTAAILSYTKDPSLFDT